ncbi:glycosyltransferase family 2 protein [Streptomyces sp. NBC_01724]|uniref:glycosyltransferase family 2 protein n=1 Tax=Streptomyces TaxID=1883 RepID=UPI0028C39012|nr:MULTISPECIES: glycosyltransferase family A protein [unclassified Streptomyces]WNO62823.1 glycosyltransferase family A protein [Streptomyces sp. AM2-3-1]WTE49688.1 glycosyltransferase family 2 protein [Streptomyces sp. NBC_01620]WTE57774.1 glycosyltransferase family 2 protein [Streptomyces sp. NBC_01617]
MPHGSDPVVSVVIPCHDYARYLPEAVSSVLAQTFRDWELVIVDDGSTDDTVEVTQSLIACHPDRRIRLLQQSNAGVSAARNTGIEASTGRYILPLDADDVIAATMLEKTVGVLDSDPGIAIASTDVFTFTDDDLPPQAMPLPAYSRELLLQRLIMFYCSLYRRAAWQTVGGYNESMRAGEDWDFWIGCVEHGFDAHHIHEALFGARNKDTGLHLEAAENDLAIRARIVANHPGLFKPITRGWAQAVLSQDAEAGLRDERVPDDILTRAAEMDQFLTAVMALQRTTRVQYYHIKRLEKALAAHNGTAGPIPQERGPAPTASTV